MSSSNPSSNVERMIPVSSILYRSQMPAADLREVLTIEKATFKDPWNERDFRKMLCRRDCQQAVFKVNEKVVAYAVWLLHPTTMSIENLAVRPEFQRCGIGRQIIDVLASKLRKVSGLNQLTADVADFNIGAQLFFSACGFSAVGVFWGKYRDGSDAYCFVRTADTSPQTPKTSLNATQR